MSSPLLVGGLFWEMLPGIPQLQPSYSQWFLELGLLIRKKIPCFYYLFCFNGNYIGIFLLL